MMTWPKHRIKKYAAVKHGFAFKSEFFCSEGIYILLTPGNFQEEGGFRWLGRKQKYYSGEIPNGYLLKKDDLLVAMTEQAPGLLGSAVLIPEDDRYLHNQRLGLLQISSTDVSKHFLFHVLNSIIVRKPISETSAGTKVKHTSPEKIGNLFIPVPPIEQQTAIGSLLSTWDEAIEKTERLTAVKQRQLTALTQDLLTGNKRIKGFVEKWRKYRLSEVLTEHREFSSGCEKVYSVSVHKGLINQIEHLGRVFAAKDTSNYNLVKPGDVVYTKSPTGDFPYGIVKQSRIKCSVIVSPLYGVFTPRSLQLGTFLNFYFESPVRTANYLVPIIQKGAKNTINITNSTFLSNSLYLPTCDEEAKAIADILNTARQEIDLLKKKSEAYRMQKRGLMQKLLTGDWRVNVREEK